jgi:hypothetical protein
MPVEDIQTPPLMASRFTEAMASVARQLPYPRERLQALDPDIIQALISAIDQAAKSADVIDLARQLTSKQLASLFPALARDNLTRRQVDRLHLILRERACQSLYNSGWLALQETYPNQAIRKALAILCAILEIKEVSQEKHKPGHLPLISQICPPHSRHFVKKLADRLAEKGLTLERFARVYYVRAQSPFAQALAEQVFVDGSVVLYPGSQELFAMVLRSAPETIQAAILRHYLSLTSLDPTSQQQYRVQIFEILGEPDAGHPVWRHLSTHERAPFGNWVMQAIIRRHCRQNPAKAAFYLRYAAHLRRIEFWDEETILIYFANFVIADQRSQPDQALYYDQPVASEHPFGLAINNPLRNPASPAIPHRQVVEMLRRSSTEGVIQLLFDPEGIKLSGVLLDFALQKGHKKYSAVQ